MTWIVKTAGPHPCQLPLSGRRGDVWCCDACGSWWEAKPGSVCVPVWRRLGERQKARISRRLEREKGIK